MSGCQQQPDGPQGWKYLLSGLLKDNFVNPWPDRSDMEELLLQQSRVEKKQAHVGLSAEIGQLPRVCAGPLPAWTRPGEEPVVASLPLTGG